MKKNKICQGCGIKLQDENVTLEGYTTSLENTICQRCFRMRNYGEYQVSTKSNEEYIEILKTIGKTKDLVLHIVDLLNIDKDLTTIRQYISNKMILVLNKRDVLPKSVNDEKIIEYFKNLDISYEDIIIISTTKNYNIDTLFEKINKLKTSKDVYVVGHTNTGKSSLINKMIQNYSENTNELTISPLPSTTLNKINIDLNDQLTLIDTPGLIDRGSIVNYVDSNLLKKINPRKEIKPKTYQLRKNQCLMIGDYLRVDYVEGDKNSFTVYVSNDIKIKRMNALRQEAFKDLAKTTYEVKYYEDLVINGLGFIKIVEKGKIDVYIDKNIETFIRKALI
ncbi:MAG: ribosome biogenesis GTPase YqeH [Firmicutes bacterium]|nr:ribosome biogenesis GTPase YqeH [Bacillota bacterium]